MAPSISSPSVRNPDERIPRFVNINSEAQTGSKTLDAAWSFPMVREVVDTLLDAHEKQVSGKGWIPKELYQIGVNYANNGLTTGLKLAETTLETTKAVSENVPTVIQQGIETALEKAKSGVEVVDDFGASGLEKLREALPFVGDPSEVAKEKAFNQGKKLSLDLQDIVSASWIGQTTLGALDTTLTLTEKPLAFIGNVDVVTAPKKSENGESEAGNGEKVYHQFKIEKQPESYSLDVYTYGLHGKLIETARYFLRKVRHTRRTIRTTRIKARKVLASKQRRSERRRLTPKKRIASLAETGTVGYVASVFQVDQLLKYFGLRIIPADRLKARQLLYPHMKLVPKCAPNPQEDAANIAKERIRSKRNRQSESEGDEQYDEAHWIKQIDEFDNYESDNDPDYKPSDTSLDSIESFEYASASEGTPQKSPDRNHKSDKDEHASQEHNESYHGDH